MAEFESVGGGGAGLLGFHPGGGIPAGVTYFISFGMRGATENQVQFRMPYACTVSNLHCNIHTSPGVGESIVCTMRKEGADTSLTCTFGAADVEAEDIVNSVDYIKGDFCVLKMVTSAGIVGNRFIAGSIEVEK